MKKMIMFVSYDFSEGNSGSKVRPRKMYEAFKRQGYEVHLISGNKSEKILGLKEMNESKEDYDFAYIEPSAYPLDPLIDYRIMLAIRKKTEKIGVFYRDAYWLFEEYFNFTGIKRLELILRYKIDLFLYEKISNVVFFPSDSMADLFNIARPKIALPPGTHNNVKLNKMKKESKESKAIYVGGISKEMGLDILLDSFEMVNREKKVLLTLVCRPKDMNNNMGILSKYLKSSWLTIKHMSGEELDNEYLSNDFAIIPRPKNIYNDFAMPIKLFEYLSNGLPILTTNCFETEKLILKHELGLVTGSRVEDFCMGIKEMTKFHYSYQENVINYINEIGTWDERVKQVITYFSAVES